MSVFVLEFLLCLTLNCLSRYLPLARQAIPRSLAKTMAPCWGPSSRNCWLRYRPVLWMLATARTCVPPLAVIECALILPQPFMGINPGVYQDFNSTSLSLVDGGEDREVVPLAPLLVKARNLDVIVAIDASSDDSDNWPE